MIKNIIKIYLSLHFSLILFFNYFVLSEGKEIKIVKEEIIPILVLK